MDQSTAVPSIQEVTDEGDVPVASKVDSLLEKEEEEAASETDDMPPLEDIKEELSAPAHGKNIKGITAEGDSEPDDEPEESKDGWTDILNNGDLRKKIIIPGPFSKRPPRGAKVTMRLVTRLYDGPDSGAPTAEATGQVIPGETFETIDVIIGDNDLYQGLDLLLPLMDQGERARLLVKPRFGYGPTGHKANGIPGDTTLDLDVEILAITVYDDNPLAGNPLSAGSEPEPGEPNPIVALELLPERIRIGNYKKGRGNFWFERGEYSLAIQCYRGAIRFLDAGEEELALADGAKKGKLGEQTPEVTEKVREIEELIDKRAQTYNNLAAAQLKLQSYDKALSSVEDSLLLRPENVKALYRRSKIRHERGDLDEAIADMKLASQLDPASEAIALELDRLQKILARQLKEQRQMYRRMMQVKEEDKGEEKKDSSGSGKSSSEEPSTSSATSAPASSKSKSARKSWLQCFSTTTTLSAVGALAAAVVLPSLYLTYLK